MTPTEIDLDRAVRLLAAVGKRVRGEDCGSEYWRKDDACVTNGCVRLFTDDEGGNVKWYFRDGESVLEATVSALLVERSDELYRLACDDATCASHGNLTRYREKAERLRKLRADPNLAERNLLGEMDDLYLLLTEDEKEIVESESWNKTLYPRPVDSEAK